MNKEAGTGTTARVLELETPAVILLPTPDESVAVIEKK
jgi:hypothetical protein